MSNNHVELTGTIDGDPKCYPTKDGNGVVSNFRVLTVDTWKDKHGKACEERVKHTVICFGPTAKIIKDDTKSGDKVRVEGKIKYEKYTNKDGIEVYATKIICSKLDLTPAPDDKHKDQDDDFVF